MLAGEHLRSAIHVQLWYYWPTRLIPYYIQDTAGSALQIGPGTPVTREEIETTAARAFSAWSSTSCTDLSASFGGYVVSRDSNMTSNEVNNRATIIFRGGDWVGFDCLDAIACTTVVTKRAAGEIIDADIDLNALEHDFVLDPDVVENHQAFDLQSVLTHEIGHLVGFNHTQVENAVMWPYTSGGPESKRRELAQDDIELLCGTYPTGMCTVINDYGQTACFEPGTRGCTVAVSPGPNRLERGSASLGSIIAASLFALALATRRSRFR